jgi:hypothetical protein
MFTTMNTTLTHSTAFSNFLSDFNASKNQSSPVSTPIVPVTSETRKADFNKKFSYSAKGHLTAIDSVYKPFFGKACKVIDVTGKDSDLDTKLGVDYIVEVTNEKLQKEVQFWIQERFRTTRYQSYQTITLIESNCYSGHLSEIYKSKAQFLVYGYYDEETGWLTQAVVVSLPQLFQKIAMNQIEFDIVPNKQTNQRFISVSFKQLEKHGLIVHSFDLDLK